MDLALRFVAKCSSSNRHHGLFLASKEVAIISRKEIFLYGNLLLLIVFRSNK
jgi:hypothetical protein